MRIIDPTGMDTLNMYLPEVTVSSKMPKNGFILAADSYYPQLKTIEAEPEMQVTYQTVSHLPMPGTGGWKSLWQGIKSLPKLIQGGSKLLGRAIGTNSKNIKWILSKHGVDQASKYANKSKFYNVATETDVKRLVDASTHMSVTVQSNGNHLRVVYADRIIGFDANTQRVTNVYSVITNPKTGELITMFPGLP